MIRRNVFKRREKDLDIFFIYISEFVLLHCFHTCVIICYLIYIIKATNFRYTVAVRTENKLYELKILQPPMERFVFIGKTTEFSCSASIPPGFSESVAFAWEKDDSKTIENSIQVFPCYFFHC